MARVRGTIFFLVFLAMLASAHAEVPQQLHYQGFLTNAAGEAVDCPDPIQCGDSFNMTFRLYLSADSGTPIWEESLDSVAIYMGAFHTQLGNVNPLTSELLNGSVWLALKINDQEEMAPRQAIGTAPFALRAELAEHANIAVNADQLGGVNAADYALSEDVPTEDNDTLGNLACATGMVPKATATGWVCDLDQVGGIDTTLSNEEVLTIVSGAGYVSGPHTVDTNTQLTEEQVDEMVGNNGFAIGPHTVDTNTQLTEAQVDEMVANNGFAVGPHTVNTDALNALSCEAGQVAQWDGSAWVCATINSDGLSLTPPKPCGPDAVGAMYFDPVDNTFKICDGTDYLGVKFCKNECPLDASVMCGAAVEDDCGNSCESTGTGLNIGQCDPASTVQCGTLVYDDCGNECGFSGTGLNNDQCTTASTPCGQPVNDNCGNPCSQTGTYCEAGFCNGTNCVNSLACNGGSLLAQSPDSKIAICQNGSCEQDKGNDCPTGFHLCTLKEWNLYNDGWSESWSGTTVGAIYCRPSSGAGHLTLSGSSSDTGMNCDWGSSNPWCTSSYGCNETQGHAACCVDNPNCGDGVVDSVLEECDDGNGNNGDGCDNDCKTTFGSSGC